MKLKTENRQKSTPEKQIRQAEEELKKMEEKLNLCYCEMGKAILETAETEGKKVNELVDRIVAAKRKLVDLEQKNTADEKESTST